MKITKLVHSCLLVEDMEKRLIVDPGNYSWESGVVDKSHVKNIDYVVITHIHPDHCDDRFIQEIHSQSPKAQWYSTKQVVEKLAKHGIVAHDTSETNDIRFIKSEHADLSPWFNEQPEHTSFVLFGELLISGDCHAITKAHGARVFGVAINGGPWGSVVGFSKMIKAMTDRPSLVLPLHDWHFNDEARSAVYAKLPEVLEQLGVGFIPLESGKSQNI